jgi:MFS family permease
VYVFGAGYNLILRSLLSELVEPQHRGALFNGVAAMETIGVMISSPLLAVSYQVGLRWDGIWLGLPFMVGGVLFTLGLGILFAVRVSRTHVQHAEQGT